MHYGRNIYGQLLQLCTAQTHCLRIPRLGTDPFFYVSQVVVVDEIGTELEAAAARTISQRGVQMIATAHGHTLENLLKNPTLNDLVGGVTSVTLGDDEARRRRVQKSVLEREGPPTFGVAVEMLEIGRWRVHLDVGVAVDTLLQGYEPHVEIRAFDENTGHVIKQPWLGEGVYGVNGGGLFSASSGKGLSQSPHTASLIAHTRLTLLFTISGRVARNAKRLGAGHRARELVGTHRAFASRNRRGGPGVSVLAGRGFIEWRGAWRGDSFTRHPRVPEK